MRLEIYCGGPVETNGYLLIQKESALVVDAPQGMASWLANQCRLEGFCITGLLLTHGHWDHIVDARVIQRQFRVPVWIHKDSLFLLENPSIQSQFNPFCDIEPCKADHILKSESRLKISPFELDPLLCPGHCPGSLCLHFFNEKLLFGGDVLFAGGVGRWDLPGGSKEKLMKSIESKILVLSDDIQVFPGHGPATTVGKERQTNPYLADLKSNSEVA